MTDKFNSFYIIYSSIDGDLRIKYIGSRNGAQGIVRDLIVNSCRGLTPQDFTIKEFLTVSGIVVSEKEIDI